MNWAICTISILAIWVLHSNCQTTEKSAATPGNATSPSGGGNASTGAQCGPDKPTTFCVTCTSMGICFQNNQSAVAPCPVTAPYCNKNRCQAEAVQCDDKVSDESKCLNMTGFVPDVVDCTGYYQCIRKGGEIKATRIQCPALTVYNAATKTCAAMVVCYAYAPMNLCWIPGTYVAYPPMPRIFGRCGKDSSDPAMIAVCPKGYQFVAGMGSCQPVCNATGRIADAYNSSNYYECMFTGITFSAQPRTCPDETTFDESKGTCEVGGADGSSAKDGGNGKEGDGKDGDDKNAAGDAKDAAGDAKDAAKDAAKEAA